MRFLGIDPGTGATGFGVVERVESRLVHVAHGVVRPRPRAGLAERLALLHREVARVIEEHAPDAAAVEQVFVSASPRSALILGQARGAVVAALGAAGLEVAELAPRTVKQAVCGTGTADKRQIQRIVGRLLGLERLPPTDAADALAVALCRAQAGRLASLGEVGTGRSRRGPRSRAWRVRRAR